MIAGIWLPDPHEAIGFRNCIHVNKVNGLEGGEGWPPDPSPPRIGRMVLFTTLPVNRGGVENVLEP